MITTPHVSAKVSEKRCKCPMSYRCRASYVSIGDATKRQVAFYDLRPTDYSFQHVLYVGFNDSYLLDGIREDHQGN